MIDSLDKITNVLAKIEDEIMRAFPCLVIASLNRGKQEEFRELFSHFQLQVGNPSDFMRNPATLDRVEKHGKDATYRSHALAKCQTVFQAAKCPAFADDSGLEITALNGEPGVRTALTNTKELLKKMDGKSDRSAIARAVLAFQVEGLVLFAEGICPGKLTTAPRGDNGFGFDTIFVPDAGDGRTFAEMSQTEKNQLSHRGKAVAELVRLIREREVELVRP